MSGAVFYWFRFEKTPDCAVRRSVRIQGAAAGAGVGEQVREYGGVVRLNGDSAFALQTGQTATIVQEGRQVTVAQFQAER